MLTLSREGDLTSESKGIVDSLRMTYDGMRLAAVHDYAAVPSVATSSGLVVQGNQYYPFGMSFATNKPVNDITEEQVNIDLDGNVIGGGDAGGFIPGGGALSGGEGGLVPQAALLLAEQPYRFGGKELYSSTGTYDFLARQYDPALCRFTTPDPLASKYPSISPYAYCGNDPINRVDPDGRDIWQININGELVSVNEDTELDCFQIVDQSGNAIKSWGTTGGTFQLNTNINEKISFSTDDTSSGFDVFEFLAENTDVEMGDIISSNGINGDLSVLSTSGSKSKIDLITNAQNLDHEGYVVHTMIHSHPNNTLPSGKDLSLMDFFTSSMQINPVSMVYRVDEKIYQRYDNSKNGVFETYHRNGSNFTRGISKQYKK